MSEIAVGVKRDQISPNHPVEQLLSLRNDTPNLIRRERSRENKNNLQPWILLLQHLRHQHEVVVVHPHKHLPLLTFRAPGMAGRCRRIRRVLRGLELHTTLDLVILETVALHFNVQHLLPSLDLSQDGGGISLIDLHVGFIPPRIKASKRDHGMQNRPDGRRAEPHLEQLFLIWGDPDWHSPVVFSQQLSKFVLLLHFDHLIGRRANPDHLIRTFRSWEQSGVQGIVFDRSW
mmetsp:Transcript_10390/g.22772  ORF Transcript_10390/g.22772 Transcript_10390/m.22772 type:complete len:232 (-) Transcript_10390:155-850(-)